MHLEGTAAARQYVIATMPAVRDGCGEWLTGTADARPRDVDQ
jgi:hypothetical protein